MDIARREPAAEVFFNAEPWLPPHFRTALKETACLRAFDAYMEDYGHRGIGESDVMSSRLADKPQAILSVLRLQLGATPFGRKEVLSRQERTSVEVLAEIKRRLARRLDRWFMYRWWYRRLCRFFALREVNRHHLMYFSTATHTLLLHLGDLLVTQGKCEARDDIFFLTVQDRTDLVSQKNRNWREIIRERRAERNRNAAIEIPDTIRDWETATTSSVFNRSHGTGPLVGLPISAGSATGPVRLLRSLTDWSNVKSGDILVAPVIDPGMALLFGIAGGLYRGNGRHTVSWHDHRLRIRPSDRGQYRSRDDALGRGTAGAPECGCRHHSCGSRPLTLIPSQPLRYPTDPGRACLDLLRWFT